MAKRINTRQLIIFALPNFALSALFFPLVVILPNFYAKYTQASLVAIGSVLLFTRLFDAVSDPLIGYLSDKTQSRWGNRKPWIAAGTTILVIPAFYLFNPPSDAEASYYFGWALLLYLGWTMIQIPYFAWSTELVRNYEQRTRVSGFLALFGALGNMVFIVAPLALVTFFGTSEYTPKMMFSLSTSLISLMVLLIIITLLTSKTGDVVASKRISMRGMLQSVRNNKPFWIYASAFAAGGIGTGITLSVLAIYIDHYLTLAASLPILLGAYTLAAFIGIPLVVQIIKHIDKQYCWALCWFISALIPPFFLFLDPGESALIPLLIGFFIIGVASAGSMVLPITMLGDVIDYDIFKTRVNRSANYFSINALLTKGNVAIGGGFAFYLLAAFGFEIGTPNSEFAVNGLLFVTLILPSLFYLLAGILLLLFPLSRKRQAIILKKIEQRVARNLI